MNKFLCHPGRSFTLDGLEDHAEAVRKSMIRKRIEAPSVSEVLLSPVSDPLELEYLTGLVQFYRIPNKVLFKIVRVATGFVVRDRWVAVRAIMTRAIPIPVPKLLKDVRHG